MSLLAAYSRFMVRNPVFSLYAIGVKVIIGQMIYTEIRDKMRTDGETLAK